MANISAEIAAFQNAAYGEDVRSALVSLANKLNNDVISEISNVSEYIGSTNASFFNAFGVKFDYDFNTSKNGVYLWFEGTAYLKSNGISASWKYSSTFNDIKVTSPISGRTNSVYIPHNNQLIYDIDDNTFKIVNIDYSGRFIPIFIVSTGLTKGSIQSSIVVGGVGLYLAPSFNDTMLFSSYYLPGSTEIDLSEFKPYSTSSDAASDYDRIIFRPVFLPKGSLIYATQTTTYMTFHAIGYTTRGLAESVYSINGFAKNTRDYSGYSGYINTKTALMGLIDKYSDTYNSRQFPYIKIDDSGWYIIIGAIVGSSEISSKSAAIHVIVPSDSHGWDPSTDILLESNVCDYVRDIVWKRYINPADTSEDIYYRAKGTPIEVSTNDFVTTRSFSGIVAGGYFFSTENAALEAYNSDADDWFANGTSYGWLIQSPRVSGIHVTDYSVDPQIAKMPANGWIVPVTSIDLINARNHNTVVLSDDVSFINDEIRYYVSKSTTENTNDIITLNADVEPLLEQLTWTSTTTGPTNQKMDLTKRPLVLLHMSDIHNDQTTLLNAYNYYTTYEDYIDGAIVTGDLKSVRVHTEVFTDMWAPYSDKLMYCLGNHDMQTTSGWTTLSTLITQEDAYTEYFEPYLSQLQNLNIVLPSHKTYWYRDFTEKRIRLITINTVLLDSTDVSEQLSWLNTTLASAITNNLHVIIGMHFTIYKPVRMPVLYSTTSVITNHAYDNCTKAICEAVETFVNNGGTFICYLSGHRHEDILLTSEEYPNQYCICVTTASHDNNQTKYDTVSRSLNPKNYDDFNIVSFDTYSNTIRLVKIGADHDSYMRNRKFLTFNYLTGEIIIGEE